MALDGIRLATQDGMWQERRDDRAQLAREAAKILKTRPFLMRARSLAREIAPMTQELRVARLLGWGFRDQAQLARNANTLPEILAWPSPGNGTRYGHRDWLPILRAVHGEPDHVFDAR